MQIMHGWLLRDDTQSWTVGGIAIDPATKTRREEYNWVLDKIDRYGWSVLDAAAGYIPRWHELPTMLSNKGYSVTACDFDDSSLKMPHIRGVIRQLADITKLPFADKSFDISCCISVLEHMESEHMQMAANELIRVTQGQILITADNGWWLPSLFGEACFISTPAVPALNPPVYKMEITL